MPATEKQITVHQIDYQCDECGKGVMRWTGMVLTSMPAQFPHGCTECSARGNYLVRYPSTEYREVASES